MKTSRIPLVMVLLALAPIAGYSFALPTMFQHATLMSVSPDLPAAQARVKFAKTDNGNISIYLMVKYMAEPHKLQPPASVYVAWVRADQDSTPQNVGAIKVNDHRVGSLKTDTPLNVFELFVTAETDGQVQTPTGQRLIWVNHTTD